MSKKFKTLEEFMLETLDTEEERIGFLEVALEEYQKDGDAKVLMRAIEYVAKSRGGISKLAEKTQLNRQNLYKIFSSQTSPRLDTLTKILQALDFNLCIQPAQVKSCQ